MNRAPTYAGLEHYLADQMERVTARGRTAMGPTKEALREEYQMLWTLRDMVSTISAMNAETEYWLANPQTTNHESKVI